ncbi:hypothetical protein [Anaeromyxobacter oryzae]|uniref:Uncharacterized protein n=1 Tax=Anaeromyxobacter oryzae TaxID=2918170 RepID=A0ABN6MS42_9BACT|nr:hypothetical protein [Anaeromyxobacter oryzae]BDG03784.1 hypothetical protein AMOR_27800 [Anaeromyxobacter oryzae]
MPGCPHLERCGLHHNLAMQAAIRVWRSFYCDGTFARCERFKLVEASADVPPRLLPNGRLLDGADGAPDRRVG